MTEGKTRMTERVSSLHPTQLLQTLPPLAPPYKGGGNPLTPAPGSSPEQALSLGRGSCGQKKF